jgi:hypothetical protein
MGAEVNSYSTPILDLDRAAPPAPWPGLGDFEYGAVSSMLAALRLAAMLREGMTLAGATLLVSCERGSARVPSSGDTQLILPGGALLWQVTFELSLELVECPHALFELDAPGYATWALPAPLRAVLDGDSRRHPHAMRRHLTTLAAAVSLCAAPAGALGSAAAYGAVPQAGHHRVLSAGAPSSRTVLANVAPAHGKAKAKSPTHASATTTQAALRHQNSSSTRGGRGAHGKASQKSKHHPASSSTPGHTAGHAAGKSGNARECAGTGSGLNPGSAGAGTGTDPSAAGTGATGTSSGAGADGAGTVTGNTGTGSTGAGGTCASSSAGTEPGRHAKPKKKKAHRHHRKSRHSSTKPLRSRHHKNANHTLSPHHTPASATPPQTEEPPAAPYTTPVLLPAPAPAGAPVPSTTSAPNGNPLTDQPLAELLATPDIAQPPAFLIPFYKQAEQRYQVPWYVLAAINAIETNYGGNLNVSSAGAMGWMQFMPDTWEKYGVAAAGTGPADPYDARDAIFSAANYLKASGAAQNLRAAIFAYNHATWYVDEVLALSTRIATYDLRPDSTAKAKLDAMSAMANVLDGLPYVYGGGHSDWTPVGGYDCSGFVSAVLHAGGYLAVPSDTQALPSGAGIQTGPGKWVTIFDRTDAGALDQDHVIIDLNGEFWESGGVAGAGVHRMNDVSSTYLASFNEILHPEGL